MTCFYNATELMQHNEFVHALEEEWARISSPERNPSQANSKTLSNDFHLKPHPELEPTPLGNHGIKVVDQLPLTGFKASGGVLDDWIELLREDKKDGERRAEAAKTLQSGFNSAANRYSPEVIQSSSTGSTTSYTRSRHPDLQIRAHQNDKWNERFHELVEFHRTFGHCIVPYHCRKSAPLAWWVKRQRHQYKMKMDGNHSTLTDERKSKLETLGFCWDSHTSIWEERLNELIEYRMRHGHTSISQLESPKLLIWAKCQRRQFKLHRAGQKSSMTEERMNKLNAAGFCWNPRRGSTAMEKEGTP